MLGRFFSGASKPEQIAGGAVPPRRQARVCKLSVAEFVAVRIRSAAHRRPGERRDPQRERNCAHRGAVSSR
jgi:hypothetical protein